MSVGKCWVVIVLWKDEVEQVFVCSTDKAATKLARKHGGAVYEREVL